MEKLKQLWEKVKGFLVTTLLPFIRKNTTVKVTKLDDNGKHEVVVLLFNEEIFNRTV